MVVRHPIAVRTALLYVSTMSVLMAGKFFKFDDEHLTQALNVIRQTGNA